MSCTRELPSCRTELFQALRPVSRQLLRYVLGEAFQSLFSAFDCAVFLDHGFAIGRRWEDHVNSYLGLARCDCFEGPGGFGAHLGCTFSTAAMRVHQTIGFCDFLENVFVGIVSAVGTVHDLLPGATGTNVHLFHGSREASWAPPMYDLLGISHGFPHQLSRRVDDASDDDFAI